MESPSIMSHVSIGVRDLDRALAFYDAVLAPLGARRMLEHAGAVAYGKAFPEFFVQTPFDGGAATTANGVHFAFIAPTPGAVDAFYKVGLEAGGVCDGPPGPRPLYGPQYYGAFLRDLDGHKIEATFWDDSAG